MTIANIRQLNIINLPSLEKGTGFWIQLLPSLHTINVPKLRSISMLHLGGLPSLKTLSFDAGLRDDMSWYFTGGIYIYDTALTHVGGLVFKKAPIIDLRENKNLTNISFPYMTVASDKWGWGEIRVRDNYEGLALDFPKLREVRGSMSLSGVGAINIPQLRIINIDLYIGPQENGIPSCTNCLPTSLTNFTAPKLSRVIGSIYFDSSPGLVNISFPALQTVNNITINNTAAVDLREGIAMHRLYKAQNVKILGNTPSCEPFDNLQCRGAIVGNYFCGKISDPTRNIVTLSSLRKDCRQVRLSERLLFWGEMLLARLDEALKRQLQLRHYFWIIILIACLCLFIKIAARWFCK
ncbi:hypothetical protein B7463_g12705, partial [Scytalidium lignicola]